MLLLINALCLFVVIIVIRMILKAPNDYAYKDILTALRTVGIVWLFLLIITVMTAIRVTNFSVIDERISLYEEENQVIETQMDELTASYIDYESDVFKSITSESSINVALIVPELKSNELVMAQLMTYKENNTKIKILKEDRINGKVTRW